VAGRSIVPILETGDLPAQIAQFADAVHGAQIWTLANASAQMWPAAPVPAPIDPPAPEPEPDPCAEVIADRDGLIGAVGYIAGDLLRPVVKQKGLSVAVKRLVAGIQAQAAQHGISHE
jgi:hypothetical protein